MLPSSSLVLVGLAFLGTVNAEECATAELLTIASNTHLEGCTSAVGFGGFSAIWDLTEEEVQAVCASSDCLALMDAMRAMGFGDCVIPGTSVALDTDILDPFAEACSGSGSTDSSSSSISEDTVGSSAAESSSTSSTSRVTTRINALVADRVLQTGLKRTLEINSTREGQLDRDIPPKIRIMPSASVKLIVVVLARIGVVTANDECATSQLLTIASSSHVAGCTSDVGFSSISSISELTPEQVKVICGSSDCVALVGEIATLGLGDCRLPGTEIWIETDITKPFAERCSAIASSDTSSEESSGSNNYIRQGSSSSMTNTATTIAVGFVSTVTVVLAAVLV